MGPLETATEIPKAPRRPDGVVLEPPPALPSPADRAPASGIVALRDDGQVVLVRQFRYPHQRDFIEIPAGKLEPGEPPLETGKRADIVIIDLQQAKVQPVYSVESAIVYAASGSSVVTTIVDGRILMRQGQVLTVNVPAAIAKAKEYRTRVLASLNQK